MANKQATAYRNLATMLQAGVPIIRSLQGAAGTYGPFGRAFNGIAKVVANGDTMANGMARHRNVFSKLDIMLVQAGETAGDLPNTLKELAKWYEFQSRIKRNIISGSILPMMVLHVAAFIAPLPGLILSMLGKGNMSTSDYLFRVVQILLIFYIPISCVIACILLRRKIPEVGVLFDPVVGIIPLVGKALKQWALSRYCRVFGTLLKAGVPIVQCTEIATELAGNTVVAGWVKGGIASARAGNPVSEGFSRSLPRIFLESWYVGEETGELAESAQRLAESFADSAEFLFMQLSVWLPRILYALVSLMLIYMILVASGAIGYVATISDLSN